MSRFGFLGVGRVRISGDSMAPTYAEGDIALVRWFSRVPTELPLGVVVVIERDVMPGIFFIKRIQRVHHGNYWVEGDNRDPQVEPRVNDSRSWGHITANEIRGRVLLKLGRSRKS